MYTYKSSVPKGIPIAWDKGCPVSPEIGFITPFRAFPADLGNGKEQGEGMYPYTLVQRGPSVQGCRSACLSPEKGWMRTFRSEVISRLILLCKFRANQLG